MRGFVVSAVCCACSTPHASVDDAGVVDAPVLLDTRPDTAPDATAAHCQHAGDLDPSFGKNGTIDRMFGRAVSAVTDVVIDPDQRILLAGSSGKTLVTGQLALARLLPDGSLDPSFGIEGRMLGGVPGYNCWLEAIALQSDGKIVGTGGCNSEAANLGLFVVARFESNGELDPSFGTGGVVLGTPAYRGHGVAIAIDAQARIVIAGQRSLDPPDDFEADFVTARFLPNGALDTSFAVGGMALMPFGTRHDIAHDLALQSDGRILVAGATGAANSSYGLVRYNDDGSLDTTFGSGGRLTFAMNGLSASIALDASGRALIVGHAPNLMSGIARLQTNGQRDPTFADDGLVLTRYGAREIAIDPSNQTVFVTGNSDLPHFDLTRVTADGVVDATFGANGTAFAASGQQATFASALAIDAEGRIVVVATSVTEDLVADRVMEDFFVARFCP